MDLKKDFNHLVPKRFWARPKQGRTQGVGVKPPLKLDILQNFITCAKEINCFRIIFAC